MKEFLDTTHCLCIRVYGDELFHGTISWTKLEYYNIPSLQIITCCSTAASYPRCFVEEFLDTTHYLCIRVYGD